MRFSIELICSICNFVKGWLEEDIKEYNPSAFSIYFSVSAFIFQGFYTGIEKTKVLMYVTIISNLLNVYLNAGFIYGYEKIVIFFDFYGIPWISWLWSWYEFSELGVQGAAIATWLSSFIMMFMYFLYLFA